MTVTDSQFQLEQLQAQVQTLIEEKMNYQIQISELENEKNDLKDHLEEVINDQAKRFNNASQDNEFKDQYLRLKQEYEYS